MKVQYSGRDQRDPSQLRSWLARAPSEPVLDPGRPITDPHVHLWDGPRGAYLHADLLGDVREGHRVTKVVYEEGGAMYRASGPQEMRPVGEVEFARGLAAMSASGLYGPMRIAGMVAHADFGLGSAVRRVLEAEIEAGGGLMRGVRASMAWDPHDEINRHVTTKVPPGRLLDPVFRSGLAELLPLRLVFDVWLYFVQLPELTELARAMPSLPIVVSHCGGPICVGPYAEARDQYRKVWERCLRELATCPNVNVKVGGLGMSHFGFDFHLGDAPPSSEQLSDAWRPYVETCIDAFGARRCMFESNFPPDKQSGSYGAIWNAFKRLAGSASEDEKNQLFSRTADEIYGLLSLGPALPPRAAGSGQVA